MTAHRGAAFAWAMLHLGVAVFLGVAGFTRLLSDGPFWSVNTLVGALLVACSIGAFLRANRLESLSIYGKEPTQ